jgi:phosphoglycerol transferase MdoB-like AlkP superfamily enzyme
MSQRIKNEHSIYLALAYRFLLLLVLYALCRYGFYLANRSLFNHIDFLDLGYIFLGGIKFDLVAMLYINSFYILLQTIPFAFKYNSTYQRVCKWLFIVTNSIGFIANFSDFVYYKFTLKRTTATVFSQFGNEQNKFKLVLDFLGDYWYLLIVLCLFIYGFIKLYDWVRVVKAPKFTWRTYLIQIGAMVLIAGLCIIGMRGGWRHSTRPITMSNAGDFVSAPGDMGLVLNTPFTIMKTLKAVNLKMEHFYTEQKLDSLYLPIHQPLKKEPFKKLNVVFLIIESLGKEHIGALNRSELNGTYRGYTPFIDSLVDNSFTTTRTYANGRKSIDALPSIISGIPSIREPFVLSSYSGNKTNSIAQLLKEKGYETAFFHGAPNGSMGFSAYTHLAGIDQYYGKTEYNNDADFDGIWGIWDEPFMQYMAKTLNTFKQPFFATFFSVSSHHPFKVPEKYKGKFPKGPLPVQEPMGYTDMAIRKFFASAAKMPWYKNTLFVLVADHATVSYLPSYQTTPGSFSIPILFYYPGGKLKGKTEQLVQQIDIMPTVLNYLNYDKPYFAFGFDAMDTKTNHFVVNNNDGNFNFYRGDYLLIHDGVKSLALFNLKKDPLTKTNLVAQLPEVQTDMETYLKAFIQQYNNRMIKDQLTVK